MASHTDNDEPRPGLWRRFLRSLRSWFAGEEPLSSGPSKPAGSSQVHEIRELDAPLRPSAEGELYTFVVHATATWTGNGITRGMLNSRIDQYADSARRTLEERIRPIARQHQPHQPGTAESAMNVELDEGWCYDGNEVRCQFRTRVELEERVREHLTPAALRRLDLEAAAHYSKRHAELLGELVTCWRQLLENVGTDIYVPYAARLADENGPFAGAVRELVNEGITRAGDLQDVLLSSITAHQKLDVYEFVTSYDSALTAFMRYMKLDPAGSTVAAGDDDA